jgi:molecular chaperone DnaK
MIFQTESQLKELGEKLSDEHKTAIEYALPNLNGTSNSGLTPSKRLDKINAAWKTATEAMYAQGEQGGQPQDAQPQGEAGGDQVQDVD